MKLGSYLRIMLACLALALVGELIMLVGSVISFDADARSLALHVDPNYSALANSNLNSVSRHEFMLGIALFCMAATFVSGVAIAYTWGQTNRPPSESLPFKN